MKVAKEAAMLVYFFYFIYAVLLASKVWLVGYEQFDEMEIK